MTATTAPFTMTAATNANPIVVTKVGCNVRTGDQIVITGVVGNTAANGTWMATRVDNDNFSIPTAGNGAWISGGLCTVQNRTVVTFAGARVNTGDNIVISGVVGNTALNGTWAGLTRVDDNSFVVPVTANAAWASGGYCVVNPILSPSPCYYWGYIVTTTTAVAAITLYDNASAASGTVIDVIPSGTAAGTAKLLTRPLRCNNGLFHAPVTGTGRLIVLAD